MDHFGYSSGVLHVEDVPVASIAEAVGTPFYAYSTATLERHYRLFERAFDEQPVRICFAVKANPNKAVLSVLARAGAGADVVSAGEMHLAMAAGIPADRIVFSGVGKTRAELEAALEAGIYQINVESENELHVLSDVAQRLGRRAPVAFRVNPDVGVDTHEKIATGRKENKFGIDWERIVPLYRTASGLPGIDMKGVGVHIGSQILDLAPFRQAFERVRTLVGTLRAEGLSVERVDLGGGVGISYRRSTNEQIGPDPGDYAALAREYFADLGVRLICEPGRVIAGNAGMLISRVVYIKKGLTRTFVILDAGLNDLIRPALYEAWHEIIPVVQPPPGASLAPVDVVGPVCETGDTFARQRPMPPLAEGDLVAFATAGAYGAAMSSTYNGRPLVPEVLVSGNRFAVVRRRATIEEMTALESVPDWLSDR